jgi:hypothetical protein
MRVRKTVTQPSARHFKRALEALDDPKNEPLRWLLGNDIGFYPVTV